MLKYWCIVSYLFLWSKSVYLFDAIWSLPFYAVVAAGLLVVSNLFGLRIVSILCISCVIIIPEYHNSDFHILLKVVVPCKNDKSLIGLALNRLLCNISYRILLHLARRHGVVNANFLLLQGKCEVSKEN